MIKTFEEKRKLKKAQLEQEFETHDRQQFELKTELLKDKKQHLQYQKEQMEPREFNIFCTLMKNDFDSDTAFRIAYSATKKFRNKYIENEVEIEFLEKELNKWDKKRKSRFRDFKLAKRAENKKLMVSLYSFNLITCGFLMISNVLQQDLVIASLWGLGTLLWIICLTLALKTKNKTQEEI